jgi:hypothetical protein
MKSIESVIVNRYLADRSLPEPKRLNPSNYIDWANLGAIEAQRWISVKEEKPPKDKPFLSKSHNDNSQISLCCWNDSLKRFNPICNTIHLSNVYIIDITHWRPLDRY